MEATSTQANPQPLQRGRVQSISDTRRASRRRESRHDGAGAIGGEVIGDSPFRPLTWPPIMGDNDCGIIGDVDIDNLELGDYGDDDDDDDIAYDGEELFFIDDCHDGGEFAHGFFDDMEQ